MCTDEELVRVGFFSPAEVKVYVDSLVSDGLLFLPPKKLFGLFNTSRKHSDLVVVDQNSGPTIPCEWLQFSKMPLKDSGVIVSICWLFEDKPLAAGTAFRGSQMDIHTPIGWSPAVNNTIHYDDDSIAQLVFLKTENGLDVYEDKKTGKVLYRPHIE
jgi:hypothetical protein